MSLAWQAVAAQHAREGSDVTMAKRMRELVGAVPVPTCLVVSPSLGADLTQSFRALHAAGCPVCDQGVSAADRAAVMSVSDPAHAFIRLLWRARLHRHVPELQEQA